MAAAQDVRLTLLIALAIATMPAEYIQRNGRSLRSAGPLATPDRNAVRIRRHFASD